MDPLMEWSAALATEHHLIDEQHQQMITLLNDLHSTLTQTGQSDELPRQLEALCDFTMEHFATEERLMAHLNYPHLERHRIQHDRLAAQAQELNHRCQCGQQLLCSDVTEQLREWMLDHFLGEDRELGLFLQRQDRSE